MKKKENEGTRVDTMDVSTDSPTASTDDLIPGVAGADYVYSCGCYWISGNAVACAHHSPGAAYAKVKKS